MQQRAQGLEKGLSDLKEESELDGWVVGGEGKALVGGTACAEVPEAAPVERRGAGRSRGGELCSLYDIFKRCSARRMGAAPREAGKVQRYRSGVVLWTGEGHMGLSTPRLHCTCSGPGRGAGFTTHPRL